ARLKLAPEKLALALDGARQVAALPDPVGRTLRSTLLDDGLRLHQVTVPLGVVACVFESRPDVCVQIPSLTLRSGDAALLKGGAEAERANAALVDAAREGLASAGLPPDAVARVEGRAEMAELLRHDDLVDLVVPRGSSALVRHVMASTRIPVLGHAEGVCHVFVDVAADPAKAARIAVDAKTDNPSACNAAETFLLHERDGGAGRAALEALSKAGVALRASERAMRLADGLASPAAPEDFGREFGDLVASVDAVSSVEEAVAFVNRHGSRHTDVIVTEDKDAARRFVEGVDAAGVFVNASPRFADGYRYGLGAEVGISTSKIHARGPVGLDGLVTTKWILLGEGHVAAPYQGAQARRFLHRAQEPAPWVRDL
ncbi:MAG TPA: glutamate-5-semialdehyde dehydrogenase, partial [Candidatus Thermoplasmatota archaeon]|nr:glutamate-5-semialdehyde dehydrogenase [Candidatus Thermoplasmatota archaeon]